MAEFLDEMEVTLEMIEEGKPRGVANTKYNKAHTVLLTARLNLATDADILAYLQTIANKQGLIKELLRTKMKEDGYVYTPPPAEEKD